MKRFFSTVAATAGLLAVVASPVVAQGTPCSLPQATFGGSGIPNTSVICDSFGGVTIGLTAHQRFASPVVTNNGAGTYFAPVGSYPGSPALAQWNYAFFIGNATGAGGLNAALYSYRLTFDTDPAASNSETGSFGFPVFPTLFGFENSENLGFWFHTPFDPTVAGTYHFGLEQYDLIGTTLLANVGIDVVVGSPTDVVPEPASMVLLGTGLAGVAAARRKKKTA